MMTRHGLMYWYFNDTNVLVNSNLYGTDTFANTNIFCPSLRVAHLVKSQIIANSEKTASSNSSIRKVFTEQKGTVRRELTVVYASFQLKKSRSDFHGA